MKSKRIAIPVWADQICPVLDFARSILIVTITDSNEQSREVQRCSASPPVCIANRMSEAGIEVVICGALSYELLMLLQGRGIRVTPYIRGNVNEVLNAFRTGTLSQARFRLPGIPPHRKGYHRRRQGWS